MDLSEEIHKFEDRSDLLEKKTVRRRLKFILQYCIDWMEAEKETAPETEAMKQVQEEAEQLLHAVDNYKQPIYGKVQVSPRRWRVVQRNSSTTITTFISVDPIDLRPDFTREKWRDFKNDPPEGWTIHSAERMSAHIGATEGLPFADQKFVTSRLSRDDAQAALALFLTGNQNLIPEEWRADPI